MTWILTYSGKHLDLADPKPEEIDLEDIIVGLSREGRFSNQSRERYTVAQHSCMVADFALDHQLEALLHDAAEAYIRDLASPLKRMIPGYREIEERLDGAIRRKFGLPHMPSPEVIHADLVALATERRDIMPASPRDWFLGVPPHPTATVYTIWSEHESYVQLKSRLNTCFRYGASA